MIDLEAGWLVGPFTWEYTIRSNNNYGSTSGISGLDTAVLPSGEILPAGMGSVVDGNQTYVFVDTIEQRQRLTHMLWWIQNQFT